MEINCQKKQKIDFIARGEQKKVLNKFAMKHVIC